MTGPPACTDLPTLTCVTPPVSFFTGRTQHSSLITHHSAFHWLWHLSLLLTSRNYKQIELHFCIQHFLSLHSTFGLSPPLRHTPFSPNEPRPPPAEDHAQTACTATAAVHENLVRALIQIVEDKSSRTAWRIRCLSPTTWRLVRPAR